MTRVEKRLNKDQSYGGLILVVSALIAISYLFGLYYWPDLRLWLIGVPVVLAVVAILGITGWIGYTMLTTPPPAPLEPEMPSTTSPSTGTSSISSDTGTKSDEKKR